MSITGSPEPTVPGRREAMAACRSGDILVVTKLDRLARALPDARDIAAELTSARSSSASADRSAIPPTRSGGCCPTSWRGRRVESDLITMRTREGMKVARAKGWLRRKKPQPVPVLTTAEN